jgi:L-alanine-DL-glutamate epimerase-like enolase superfamily enzyme
MKVQFRPYPLKLNHTWTVSSGAKSGGGADTVPAVLLRLSDNGVIGLGEAPSSTRYSQSPDTVQTFLRKVDWTRISFDDIPGSMDYLENLAPGNYSAKCAINVALVDGAARMAGKAVCDFLGLGFSEKKHVTSFSIGIDTPAVIARKVAEAAAYPILKLKIGAPGERENLAALRRVAPERTLRVDANEGWTTKEEALRNLEWLAKDPHIQFIEQPMPAATPVTDLTWLKSRSPLPLFGDESYQHASDIGICAQCYHGVNVKLLKTGGISGAHEALKAARKAGLKTMIGCMIETSVLISAAAHLAELTDHLDIDGSLLTTNDPYSGATAQSGAVSFAAATEKTGLRVKPRAGDPFSGT